MNIRSCSRSDLPKIRDIFNEVILNSTALYEYEPRSTEMVAAWFEQKQQSGLPVLVAIAGDNDLAGFASYGPFRPHPAFRYSVEHSVYVQADRRGQGVGRSLLRALIRSAEEGDFHTMIGGIDSRNIASIRLHQNLGFTHCATIREAGRKFGRWLDLEFYQRMLPSSKDDATAPSDLR